MYKLNQAMLPLFSLCPLFSPPSCRLTYFSLTAKHRNLFKNEISDQKNFCSAQILHLNLAVQDLHHWRCTYSMHQREQEEEEEEEGCVQNRSEGKWHEQNCNMRSFKTHPLTHRGCIEHTRWVRPTGIPVTIHDAGIQWGCHEHCEGGGRN